MHHMLISGSWPPFENTFLGHLLIDAKDLYPKYKSQVKYTVYIIGMGTMEMDLNRVHVVSCGPKPKVNWCHI